VNDTSKLSGRTIIASNRLPVQARVEDGKLRLTRSAGGLVTGLEAVHERGESLWVGSLGLSSSASSMQLDEQDLQRLVEEGLRTVNVPDELYEAYYTGFSNSAIWPLATMWKAYHRVNQLFADAILAEAKSGDRVWVQDYQLMLVPKMLRDANPDLSIGFFLHIPFPSTEMFRILPWRNELLEGVLGSDLIGFHTLEYMRHFSNSVARLTGLEPQMDTLIHGRRSVRLGAFPLGIDVEQWYENSHDDETEAHLADLNENYPDSKMVLGVDRLDYTKGIPVRLLAFAAFLERHPEWIGKVHLVQLSVPSRVKVGEYREIKAEVDGLVGMINGRFGAPGYVPVHYLFRNIDRANLAALYRRADVAMVTPFRDGLNLVCKEYVACKRDEPGILVLSEFAGSAAEMGEAITVNPWSQDSMVHALEVALEMNEEDSVAMMQSLWNRLSRFDNKNWSRDFLGVLDTAAAQNHRSSGSRLNPPDLDEVLSRVRTARKVFLFVDYDGTLVPLRDKPEQAVPTDDVLALVDALDRVSDFELAIVSGRDREFLSNHLPDHVRLVAEHGALIRYDAASGFDRLVDEQGQYELREHVLGIMRDFEARIPGSRIEEKEFGVVWHYRMSDPIFAHQQALALADTLGELLQQTQLGVLMSKKAVEVRHLGINKGEAVRSILERSGFDAGRDLVLTMGDDRTDEDMFRVYPRVNISISVSDGPTVARHVMEREKLVDLLTDLTLATLHTVSDLAAGES
jgi:trehalose 6-phosphate synthase/phosphatase